jgi:hypothetical protein
MKTSAFILFATSSIALAQNDNSSTSTSCGVPIPPSQTGNTDQTANNFQPVPIAVITDGFNASGSVTVNGGFTSSESSNSTWTFSRFVNFEQPNNSAVLSEVVTLKTSYIYLPLPTTTFKSLTSFAGKI